MKNTRFLSLHVRATCIGIGLFLCTSCASNPQRPVVTKIVPVPSELTAPVPAPQLEVDTNSALIDWIERWKAALAEANRRLEAIGNIKP